MRFFCVVIRRKEKCNNLWKKYLIETLKPLITEIKLKAQEINVLLTTHYSN